MIQLILQKIFGTQNTRLLNRLWPFVGQVNALEPEIGKLTDGELRAKTDEFKKRLADGQTLDQVLPEAFACVREASKRTTKMRHFDVQILGGVVLHQGKIAEMATGEGKTLVATLPIYLNALLGKGVHLVTVNDYLARRDRNWMGPIYELLGLSVGVIQHDMPSEERRAAYAADITYGTNNEFGFDYLRDNMVNHLDQRVQRGLHYAIVDEVDSILIDEARTPLIISGPAEESTDKYYKIDRIIPHLQAEVDYKTDEKAHTVALTEDGIRHCEKLLAIDNLYENTQIDLIHHINQALKAHVLFKRDEEYVVKDDQVVIVDEFTGRLMPGRRFSDGLHQALEAKEGVTIERENQTLATITFQNYFRMYKKLAGMTGTAATEAVEFYKIYKLDVAVIPTNKPCVRSDHPDCIYRTEREKFNAVVEEIIEEHKKGRPCLVGTISIEKSEKLSQMLKRRNMAHTVLNAKYHEKEAEIIAQAGQEGAITIATNMAGRGTDIVLGPGIAQKGGLAVIGTERHEARRIDNQLRGRSGRQGDPGSSKFFISLEDDLMRIFGSDRISGIMEKLGMQEGEVIQHPLVTKSIETAQRRVESRNFEIRKHLLEYDDVMNRQREIIYSERDRILKGENLREHISEMIEDVVEGMLATYVHPDVREEDKDYVGLANALRGRFGSDFKGLIDENQNDLDSLRDAILGKIKEHYAFRERHFGTERMRFLESYILLQVMDSKWKDHLHSLDDLKEGIGLRAYGQRDPLVEYKREAFDLFDAMIQGIKEEAIEFLFRIQVVREQRMANVLEGPTAQFLHPESGGMADVAASKPKRSMREAAVSRNVQPFDESSDYFEPSAASNEKTETIRRQEPKVGRNDPCPCGSGKKYKKCHGGSAL
ncbi:MAG: preprotein translocase subunit SecA [Candidatus Omnitrophica bacterium]|nr:preprotein translocase subunit SecA [Candidatus Omnitrophota bacterium]